MFPQYTGRERERQFCLRWGVGLWFCCSANFWCVFLRENGTLNMPGRYEHCLSERLGIQIMVTLVHMLA